VARILVTGINYAPERIGAGKYTTELCEWLVQAGHQVRVVTAPPYYPAWKVDPPYESGRWKVEHIAGVEVLRCPLWVPAQPSGLKRLLHLASFAASSLPALLYSTAFRPDIVISIAPSLMNAPGAWLAARLSRGKCWLHIQDFEVGAALDMGLLKGKSLARAALAIERWLFARFDRVSTISENMLALLHRKGVPASRAVLLPNWADISQIRPLTAPSPYRAELGIPEKAIVALYSGNMNLKQGLEVLGACAKQLAGDPDIYFVFGGNGPGREALEQECKGMPNVRFLDLQPSERLSDWLGLADIHLLPQRADVADLVMPSKLTGMLASGRVTLATAMPDTALALALRHSGIVTPPGDASALSHALRELAADAPKRVQLGKAARLQAETTLARDRILGRFNEQLAALAHANADFSSRRPSSDQEDTTP